MKTIEVGRVLKNTASEGYSFRISTKNFEDANRFRKEFIETFKVIYLNKIKIQGEE